VVGSSSRNRFTGSVEIGDGAIRFGHLASTRRTFVPAVMDQQGNCT
jgi:heat shock protein HslJ